MFERVEIQLLAARQSPACGSDRASNMHIVLSRNLHTTNAPTSVWHHEVVRSFALSKNDCFPPCALAVSARSRVPSENTYANSEEKALSW